MIVFLKRIALVILISFFVFSVSAENRSYESLLAENPGYENAIRYGVDWLVKNHLVKEKLVFEDLKGGFTATKLFVFSVGNKKYVLRILPQKSTLDSRVNEINAIKIASNLGISPKFFCSDPESFIIIMPYIQGHVLSKKDIKDPDLLKKLAKLIKILHGYNGYFSRHRTQIDRVQKHYQRGFAKHIAYPTVFKKVYANYLQESKEFQAKPVYCHGDLNPSNIMVAGNKLYLIDWSSATWDNPYTDLGYLTLLSNMNEQQSQIFLNSYLGRKATNEELEKLFLAQKRTTFLTASVWFDFSESSDDKKIPFQIRVQKLDRLLLSPHLKMGREYISEGISVNPKLASAQDIQLYALGFLKEYEGWSSFFKFLAPIKSAFHPLNAARVQAGT